MAESNSSVCQPNYTWDNWAQTIEFQTACYFEPVTMNDLSTILQQAYTNGKKVRVVGSGHSWSLGAVPGTAPYVQGEQIDAYLINTSNMSPDNSAQDSYLKAFYFADSANTPYVAVPPGTTQGWLADNAANANDFLHQHSNQHEDLALASMGPAPDITLGGFIANGCHGTGWNEPTIADLIVGIEIVTVDANGNAAVKSFTINQELADILNQNQIFQSTAQASPDVMQALRVSLGALGVITKLVFQLEPMFNVAHLDEYADVSEIFPTNGDYTNLETLVTSCDYIEIFWFPYNAQLWVKRYSKTTAPTQNVLKVVGFDWITSELATLTGGLLGEWFTLCPEATPLTLQLLFGAQKMLMQPLQNLDFTQDFNPSTDAIVKVKDAYLYQTKYMNNLLDLSYTLPIVQTQDNPPKYDFSNVINAWDNVINNINSVESSGQYPVNLNVHIRFIKNSNSLLSPANQAATTTHTCYIEYLSFSQQYNQYADFTTTVGPEWDSYGGLPHWAKILQLVPGGYANAHQKLKDRGHLQPFMDLRQEFDPNDIFMNDFLNEILNGITSEAKETAQPRAAAASLCPTNYVKQFPLAGAQNLAGYHALETYKSERGCTLTHDPARKVAILVDETDAGHLLQYDYDAATNALSYRLLSASKFLAPAEVFRRIGEALKQTQA
jgi:FAD/FMN-containing dehydrogenase